MKSNLCLRVGSLTTNFVMVLTDAPRAYDGFGTFTVFDAKSPVSVGGFPTKHNARLVAVREEHLEWQSGRYQSGMHCAHTDNLEAEGVIDMKSTEEYIWREATKGEQA